MLKKKSVRLILWFFAAILFDMCVAPKLAVMNAKPATVFLLILSVALIERDFTYMLTTTIIASVVYAVMGAQSFGLELILCVCIALGVYYLRSFPRYMNMKVRMCIFTAVATAVHMIALHLYNYATISPSVLLKVVLVSVVYNVVIAPFLFSIFKKSVYREELKKESAFGYAKQ